MQAITLKDAKRNLPRLVEQVLADAEPRIVVTDKGEQVVLMPLDEFNSWQETLYLLASPKNAAHVRRSIAEADSGQAEKKLSCGRPPKSSREDHSVRHNHSSGEVLREPEPADHFQHISPASEIGTN